MYDAEEKVGGVDAFIIDGGIFDVSSRDHHQIAWLWFVEVDWGRWWTAIHHTLFGFALVGRLALRLRFVSGVADGLGGSCDIFALNLPLWHLGDDFQSGIGIGTELVESGFPTQCR